VKKRDWLRARNRSNPRKNACREVPVPLFHGACQRPKKGTGTVGKRPNHFKTRLSTEPVPIFGLPSLHFE